MPCSDSSSPSGSSSGTKPEPNVARSWSSVRWKSARCLSSLLTNTIRGMPAATQRGPRRLGADLDAIDGADDEHRQVGDGEGGVDIAGEVAVAGRVDEVDLVGLAVGGLPLERGDGERQRHRSLDLLRFGVAHRRAVFDPPRPGQHPGSDEERFGERRLAAPAVAERRRRCGSCRSTGCSILTPHGRWNLPSGRDCSEPPNGQETGGRRPSRAQADPRGPVPWTVVSERVFERANSRTVLSLSGPRPRSLM